QLDRAWRVVGAYEAATGRMVGFARAESDGISQAYLADVHVDAAVRGRGLGKAVVRLMIEEGPGRDFRRMLHTDDAHGLYAGFGFAAPDATYMERPSRLPRVRDRPRPRPRTGPVRIPSRITGGLRPGPPVRAARRDVLSPGLTALPSRAAPAAVPGALCRGSGHRGVVLRPLPQLGEVAVAQAQLGSDAQQQAVPRVALLRPGVVVRGDLVVDPGEGAARGVVDQGPGLPVQAGRVGEVGPLPLHDRQRRQPQARGDPLVGLVLPGGRPDQLERQGLQLRAVRRVEQDGQRPHPAAAQIAVHRGPGVGQHRVRGVAGGPPRRVGAERVERAVHVDEQQRALDQETSYSMRATAGSLPGARYRFRRRGPLPGSRRGRNRPRGARGGLPGRISVAPGARTQEHPRMTASEIPPLYRYLTFNGPLSEAH